MPVEPDLPAELRSTESLLRRFSPVDSEINRDATLYRAGWAAAKMQAQGRTPWLWPATSAVLATALLLITLPPASLLQRTGTEPKNTAKKTNLPTPSAQQPQPRPYTPAPRKRTSLAPFLAMRDRALRMEFDEPFSYAGFEDDDEVPKAVTARELMQELLGEAS